MRGLELRSRGYLEPTLEGVIEARSLKTLDFRENWRAYVWLFETLSSDFKSKMLQKNKIVIYDKMIFAGTKNA